MAVEEVTRNKISSEIGKLISEGNLSGAYAKFEELPIIEQISLSIAPGIGDALAAYEVKEFGSRGIQNIREGNVFGGLGNLLMSGLAGASLIPILRAGRGLTRVARMGDDMGGGPSSMVEFKPNEYVGTRPTKNMTGSFGLKSPNREALQKMDQPKKLGSLVADLRKAVPGKEGELRLMRVIDENNDLTPEIKTYFRGVDKVTPAGLDQYLAKNQGGINLLFPNKSKYAGDVEINGRRVQSEDAIERVYMISDVESGKISPTAHYNEHYDNVFAFDSTEKAADGSIKINRVQSDYSQELNKRKAAVKEYGKDSPFLFDSALPYKKLDNLDELRKDLDPLVARLNKEAKKLNYAFGKQYDELFDAEGLPKFVDDPKKFDKLQPFMTDIAKNDGIYKNLQTQISRLLDEKITGTPNMASGYGVSYTTDLDLMPEGMRKIIGREMDYDLEPGMKFTHLASRNNNLGPSDLNFNIGIFGSKNPSDIKQIKYFGGTETENILDTIKKDLDRKNMEIMELNTKLYKKDPYATKTGTREYVLPIRSLVNEMAQTTDSKYMYFDIDDIASREGMKSNRFKGNYHKMGNEFEKIAKELDIPLGSTFKTGSKYTIDLDEVRKALKEGKRISAFKDGGFASRSIASALNNL